jgi:hypothetical protein
MSSPPTNDKTRPGPLCCECWRRIESEENCGQIPRPYAIEVYHEACYRKDAAEGNSL